MKEHFINPIHLGEQEKIKIMKYSDLKLLINMKYTCNYFLNNYRKEILEYIKCAKSDKNVRTIIIDYDEASTKLKVSDLIIILDLYLNNSIGEWELEYILSSLEVLEIDNERIENVIFNFSNPYLNTYISYENISRAIKYLKKESLNLKLEVLDIKQKRTNFRPNYKSILIVS